MLIKMVTTTKYAIKLVIDDYVTHNTRIQQISYHK